MATENSFIISSISVIHTDWLKSVF